MKSHFLTAIVCAAFATTGFAQDATTGTAAPAGGAKLKVGLVFDVGGRGDKSFNDAAYAGLSRAEKELGIKGDYREPGEGSQREAHLRGFAKGDTGLVIGVGFLFTDEIKAVAEEFGSKNFACVDFSVSDDMPKNLAALTFREEEGSFLIGALAALTSKTGKIGFVGGVESPLIKKFEAGYTQGAKHVKPTVEVKVAYAGVSDNAFKDPQKGKELASSMYDSGGVDIIYHASGSTGLGVFKSAEERKKLAIGVDRDQSDEAAPGVILTSMTKNTDQAVFNTIKETAEGKFKGGVHAFGLKEDGVGYVYNDKNKALIGEETYKKVEELKAKIISGEIKVKATP